MGLCGLHRTQLKVLNGCIILSILVPLAQAGQYNNSACINSRCYYILANNITNITECICPKLEVLFCNGDSIRGTTVNTNSASTLWNETSPPPYDSTTHFSLNSTKNCSKQHFNLTIVKDDSATTTSGQMTYIVLLTRTKPNCHCNIDDIIRDCIQARPMVILKPGFPICNTSEGSSLKSQIETLNHEVTSKPSINLNRAKEVIATVSNTMNKSLTELQEMSNEIIKLLEQVAQKVDVQGQSVSIDTENLYLLVQKVNVTEFNQMVLTTSESSNLQSTMTLPASLFGNLKSDTEQRLVSRVQFIYYKKTILFQKSVSNSNMTLISGVLGCSVANLSISNLQENVEIAIRHASTLKNNSKISCAFWNFSLNDHSGGWSSDGCSVSSKSKDDETVCSCNHLTNFGVLMDISGQEMPDPLQAAILNYITYFGCATSVIFLSITLITYFAFRKLHEDVLSRMLIHLCLALLLLNLVFLLDSYMAVYNVPDALCISIAFLLHYFLLASFTWMALHSVHMYLAVVKVFNIYFHHFMIKLGLAGWGIPLVVVIIVIAVNTDNYGMVSNSTDKICWVKDHSAFYIGVVAYFCVIFLMNICTFLTVMVLVRRIKGQNPKRVHRLTLSQEIWRASALVVLLGLTWGFAFFSFGPVHVLFMYLFTICNSMQGFFMFVFHCAVKENVRREWRTYLTKRKYGLRIIRACNFLRRMTYRGWNRLILLIRPSNFQMFVIDSNILETDVHGSQKAKSVSLSSSHLEGSTSDMAMHNISI